MYEEYLENWDIAVAVLAFNRPVYLESCIQHLENCEDKDKVDWVFFQDGAINRYSGLNVGSQYKVKSSIEEIKKARLPNKEIRDNNRNLGNAIQTDKCLRLLDEGYDAVIRVEEDVELSKYFIRVLLSMYDQFPESVPTAYNTGDIADKNPASDMNRVIKSSESEKTGGMICNMFTDEVFRQIEDRWEDFMKIARGNDWSPGYRPIHELDDEFGDNSRGVDGVMESILNENNIDVITPIISRGSHIGRFGSNVTPQSYSTKYGNEGSLTYQVDDVPMEWEESND